MGNAFKSTHASIGHHEIMKRIFLPIATMLVLASSLAFAYEVFNYVRAVPQGNDIVVQWKTVQESGVVSFEIERKSEEVTEFRRLGRVMAKGNGSNYTFVDDGAFFKPQAGKRFTYRIKAVGSTMEAFSDNATVVHEVSSVRRSWGMIKELFR
jgi:hypothetical protein